MFALQTCEKFKQSYLQFLKLPQEECLILRYESITSRDESLVSREVSSRLVSPDEILVLQEGGNLPLSSTVYRTD